MSINQDNQDNQDIESLDPYAKSDNVCQYDQPNPFYLPLENALHEKTQIKFLMEEHKHVCILTLCDDTEASEQNLKRISLFYKKDSDKTELIGQQTLVTIVQAPIQIVTLPKVKKSLLNIDKQFLENFNGNFYELAEKELVYLMLETRESNVKSWIKLYQSENYFDKFVKNIIFRNYYRLNDHNLNEKIIDSLSKVKDFKYWKNEINCRISGNTAFDKRKFNLHVKNSWNLSHDQIEKELEKLIKGTSTNKTNSNYPLEMLNPNIYSPNENIQDYVMRSKNDSSSFYYQIIKPEDLIIQKEHLEELLINSILDEKEKYYLICNLLASKKYCHYVLTNSKIMSKNAEIFEKYKPTFRYIIAYSWISLYMEESIRRSRVKEADRFVFDIETASKLPVFPFSAENPHLNPYFSLPLSENLMCLKTNINGVESIVEYQNGIVDLAEFKRRMNVFASGIEGKDLFEGADWSNMVVTGGIMSAILPKTNPLMSLFKGNKSTSVPMSEKELNRFFEEYYSESDIDIACNHKSILDFIKHVISITELLRKNLGIQKAEIKATANKSVAIYINETILKEKCLNKEIPFDFEYIKSNLQQLDVKFYFYEIYLEQKKQSNKNNMSILGDRIKEKEYFNIINYCDFEKTSIIINDYGFEKENMLHRSPEYNSGIEMMYYINENNNADSNIFMMMSEILKFSIESEHLKHPIEMFKINESEFFSSVARFHLPCVRAYYTGSNCFMLPSAITSYMTMTNINYKYFSGKSSPIDIVVKYGARAYGIILNSYEIKQYISVILSNEQYKKKYDVKNITDIKKIIGSLKLDHPLFRPRKFVPENFKWNPDISLDYKLEKFEVCTPANLVKIYKNKYRKYPTEFIDKTIFTSKGEIKPFEPWMIDVGYSYLK